MSHNVPNAVKMAVPLVAATFLLAACGGGTTNSKSGGISGELVFSIYPGAFQDNYVKAVVEPFLAAHPDVRVSYVQARTSAESLAALRAEKANPSVDVSLLDLAVARTANKEGVFAALDPSKVPNLKQLKPAAKIKNNMGAGVTFDSVVLMYNTKQVSTAPTSWNALWDDPAGKGKIAIIGPPDLTSTVGLTAITTKMEGGDYRKSVDPGIAKLKKLSSRVETWNPQPDPYTMVQSGQAAYGVGWNARAQLYASESKGSMKAVLPAEGTVEQINTLNLVKGAPNPTTAQAFINYALSAKAQAAFSARMPYAPTNASAKLPADVLKQVPVADPSAAKKIIPLDWGVVVAQRDTWANRLKTEVVGG